MGVNDIIKVGNNIKSIRKRKKLSQKDMAKILNIPCSTYSNYENNNREPNAKLLNKIAEVLNVNITELLSLSHSEKNNVTYPNKYLCDDTCTIQVIESLIKLCNFSIKFNECNIDDKSIEDSLKLAIKNNDIPLTYISNGHGNLDLTNEEFMKFSDKILRYVKFELNNLISLKAKTNY